MKLNLLVWVLFSLSLQAAEKPNVLLILADDLGFSDLSCYGGEIPTANLDRLATGGAKFSSFYTSARCCPSRASLITGIHPHQAGIGSFTQTKQPPGKGLAYKGALLPTCATLAEMLLDDSYSTWMVGKWHMAQPGPIARGFQNYYGYKNFLAHSEDQWDPAHYVRLPETVKPELPVKEDFYVTDVFTDYSLEFLKQARADKEKPWFLYLAHSSPHFPIQAPKESIDRHMETYRKGWDILRAERFERQKKLELIRPNATLPPLSEVPVDRDDIANGFSGMPNPTWDSLPANRREDLARRMATFAAMVEHLDQGIGRILADLEKNGELDNTLIAFLSDNGACYEWGPFGFDGRSRLGKTTLHAGDELAKVGQAGTHSSYGSGWANLGNTPLSMYKHFCHEGGIASPLILHWPKGIKPTEGYLKTPSHLIDIVPTILQATGAKYPIERNGDKITPVEGTSLLPALTDPKAIPERVLAFEHQEARGLRKGDWKLVWGKRQTDEVTWELYNLAEDRSEQSNLVQNHGVIKDELVEAWNTWAKRVGASPHILPEPGYRKTGIPPVPLTSPEIQNCSLIIQTTVQAKDPQGVVLAQGGKEHGYALHFIKGILTQPKDGLSLGQDDRTATGDYEAPNPFNGKVISQNIKTLRSSAPPRETNKASMLTEWGQKITAENAWQEYPRPQLIRENWTNLNGFWNYAITKKDSAKPTDWAGKILVPFAIESQLSGVQKSITPDDALWYQRTFTHQPNGNNRTLLNFEAVDYHSTVWVNGEHLGRNTGGNLPFLFDITPALKPGENTLTVKVLDATDTQYQLHGKQVSTPHGIWHTPVSGIWQTVWLEEVPETSLHSLKITTKISGEITIDAPVTTSKELTKLGHCSIIAIIKKKGETLQMSSHTAGREIKLQIEDPDLWSPDHPALYDLHLEIVEQGSDQVDRITSYFGIRETSVARDKDGHLRFSLNGKPLFHFGTLDQGWWPDGLLTPPSEAAMISDIQFLKEAGFNTIRKHIKIEPRRYYTHCDRMGMLVWQDQVSSGTGGNTFKSISPQWPRLTPNPPEAIWPDEAHNQWMTELRLMIDTLHNHPAIVQWVPFNERWGQHRTLEVGKWITAYDPTRQINIASGGNFFPVGDIVDHHQYPHPDFPFDLGKGGRFEPFVKVVGEFGGHGFPVADHLWNPTARNWGYGGLPKNKDEWIERYQTSIEKLVELRKKGIAAGIYTQTTDVEGEINGLITYDRRVQKLAATTLREIHENSGLIAKREGSETGIAVVAIPKAEVAPVRPVDAPAVIEVGLKFHDRALFIKNDWIRDPYITLGPDDFYYLTGTTINEEDPREETDPYNIGLGDISAVGNTVRVWKSQDLIKWQDLGPVFSLKDSIHQKPGNRIWAPEVHWIPEKKRWALVHCSKQKANFALSAGSQLKGPWTHPMGGNLGQKHDPALFKFSDTWWMLSENTKFQPLAKDFHKFSAEPIRIDPSGSLPGPEGSPLQRSGHEGATMIRIGPKFVHLGTAWSTDKGRKGSYNLYYSVADEITGPYGPRKFAGRFLGHGTPFQTRDGKWWCTAFFNANVPPLSTEGIKVRDLSEIAQTINHRGTTIVPLDIRLLENGEIYIRAKDPNYASPGPDEAQKKFE
ncbi:MAG: arylsulfatase A-like enzyme [Akkermansiaceae bacterium]|jgi:arylsulfatase A-like enzyme